MGRNFGAIPSNDQVEAADIEGLGTLATQSGTFSGTSSGTNTGDVTLAGAPAYITISGQVITRALVSLVSHVTGDLPLANVTAAEAAANKDTNTSLGTSDLKYPSQKAVKTYVDAHVGAAVIYQTEIDFGTTPVAEASFTVTDSNVSATSKLTGGISYEAPTGKDLDELEMDSIDLKFGPGVGQFTIYAIGLTGYLADKFIVNYQIGA